MIKTKYRHITTKIPHTETPKYLKALTKYEVPSMMNALPIIWQRARNASIWDIFGNKFIDFTSSIFVANVGHCEIDDAISKQSRKLIHSYTYPSLERVEFIEKLMKTLPKFCQKIYLASAGSEVTSWAVKLMYLKGQHDRTKYQKNVLIEFEGSFHGKTGEISKEDYVLRLPFPTCNTDWKEARNILRREGKYCYGAMIESYRGWDAKFFPKKYIQSFVKFCNENNISVCFDEIQGGFWRTGKMFAYEHYGVTPDLICIGKALGGGLPISAVTGKAEMFTHAKGMSSTHSANPLCCAAGLKTLKLLEEINKEELKKKETFMSECLKGLSKGYKGVIKSTTSHGMLGVIIFKNKEFADLVTQQALKLGLLLVNTRKESVKIGPPLTIEHEALLEGFETLQNAILTVSIMEK